MKQKKKVNIASLYYFTDSNNCIELAKQDTWDWALQHFCTFFFNFPKLLFSIAVIQNLLKHEQFWHKNLYYLYIGKKQMICFWVCAHVCRCQLFTTVTVQLAAPRVGRAYEWQEERAIIPACSTCHKGQVWKEQPSEKPQTRGTAARGAVCIKVAEKRLLEI